MEAANRSKDPAILDRALVRIRTPRMDVFPAKKPNGAALIQALRYYRGLGVRFERVLTDNGACYTSRCFRRLVHRLGMRHLRTRPYTPRTNGKAERLVQTSLREWAYARSYASSEQRASAFRGWLHHYNWHRPHASLGYRPPISRIPMNNVLDLHT